MRARAVFLVLMSPISQLGAQTPSFEEPRGPNASVAGVMVDAETGVPLEGAKVGLDPLEGGPSRSATTDTRGAFQFLGVPAGAYDLRLSYPGYGSLSHRVNLVEGVSSYLAVEITSEFVTLDPIVVETTRESVARRVGFIDRRGRGFGWFIDRGEIDRRKPVVLSDIVRSVPGVAVAPPSPQYGRGIVTMRGGCAADVFVDGSRMVPPFGIDDFLSVGDLEAVEIYRSGLAPPEFQASNPACGSVVVWTQRGRSGAQPLNWPRIFLASGVTVLLLFAFL